MVALPIVDTRKTDYQVAERRIQRLPLHMGIRPEQLAVPVFSLTEMLEQIPNLPAATALLGFGQDGYPLLFDLRDPRPGPILVVGDKFSGKTRLLKTIALSLIARNQPDEVQFAVLSGRPEQWKHIRGANEGYFSRLHTNYERAAATTILEMCDLVEARQNGEAIDRAVVFLVDGLDTVAYMDFGVRMNFEWLLKCGPKVQVWTIAALDTESALRQTHLVNFFRTRLVGSIHNRNGGRELALSNDLNPADLIPGSQFAVRLQRAWLKFTLPEIDA